LQDGGFVDEVFVDVEFRHIVDDDGTLEGFSLLLLGFKDVCCDNFKN